MSVEHILEKLRTYCAYQERCVADVQQKMNKLTVQDVWRDDMILSLQEEGYLNEARFAGAFARGHFRQKKWGRYKIREALKAKGLVDQDIDKGLSEIPDKEYIELLQDLLTTKMQRLKDKDPYMIKNKVARFAMSKGFEGDLVWDLLKQA